MTSHNGEGWCSNNTATTLLMTLVEVDTCTPIGVHKSHIVRLKTLIALRRDIVVAILAILRATALGKRCVTAIADKWSNATHIRDVHHHNLHILDKVRRVVRKRHTRVVTHHRHSCKHRLKLCRRLEDLLAVCRGNLLANDTILQNHLRPVGICATLGAKSVNHTALVLANHISRSAIIVDSHRRVSNKVDSTFVVRLSELNLEGVLLVLLHAKGTHCNSLISLDKIAILIEYQ